MVRDEFVKLMKNGKIKFTELQKSWINYREFYKHYRNAKTKEEMDSNLFEDIENLKPVIQPGTSDSAASVNVCIIQNMSEIPKR